MHNLKCDFPLCRPRAYVTYQEALKCDFENWRIWENFLAVSNTLLCCAGCTGCTNKKQSPRKDSVFQQLLHYYYYSNCKTNFNQIFRLCM